MSLIQKIKECKTWLSLTASLKNVRLDSLKHIMNHINRNTCITTVCFACNKLNDEHAIVIADALSRNESLVTVDLSINHIGARGARALVDALKINSRIRRFHLGCNRIGSEGATYIAELVNTNTTLSLLRVDFNSIGASGFNAMSASLYKNKTLQWIGLEERTMSDKSCEKLMQALRGHPVEYLSIHLNESSARMVLRLLNCNTRMRVFIPKNHARARISFDLLRLLRLKLVYNRHGHLVHRFACEDAFDKQLQELGLYEPGLARLVGDSLCPFRYGEYHYLR